MFCFPTGSLNKRRVCLYVRNIKGISQSPGGTPYNGLYREAPPERGTFFTLQVYERVGI